MADEKNDRKPHQVKMRRPTDCGQQSNSGYIYTTIPVPQAQESSWKAEEGAEDCQSKKINLF